VTPASKHPRWTFELEAGGRFRPIVSPELWDDLRRRRQDFPEAYAPNGAVYVMRVDRFRQTRNFYVRETVGSPMPAERSIDIDTALDLALARAMIQGRT
jgi:CMP-N-acetylneuraminic acid synthetase